MNIIGQLIEWVKNLFKRKARHKEDAYDAQSNAIDYTNTDKVNLTAVFAGKLANFVVSDSSVDIEGDGKRAEFINRAIGDVWDTAKKITTQALGKGGKVIIPYIEDGEPRFYVVDQHRVVITEMRGDRITAATIVADMVERGTERFYLLKDYSVSNGVHTIISKAVDDTGVTVDIRSFPEWENIDEEISIANVDRVLFGFLKCPVDNRIDRNLYGVPITYGSEQIIDEIVEHLSIIRREYKLTRPMLGLDSSLWRRRTGAVDEHGNKIPYGRDIHDIEMTAQDQDYPFIPIDSIDGAQPWLMFAPAIRDTAMYSRLMQLFSLLEKSVGTSRGILTERDTANATATEIKAAMYDTYCIVADCRKNWNKVIDDLAYAYDVLAEYYGTTPNGSRGDYTVKVDWDMTMYESSGETFSQLSELQSRGAISKAELRQWVKGGTLEEATEAVDEIAQKNQAEAMTLGAMGMM